MIIVIRKDRVELHAPELTMWNRLRVAWAIICGGRIEYIQKTVFRTMYEDELPLNVGEWTEARDD